MSGAKSLAKNALYGVSNSLNKITGGISNGLSVLLLV